MCDQHSTVLVYIPTAERRGQLGQFRGIDPCIAHLVESLNLGGTPTVSSCCGHGHRPGSIILADGRWLIIAPDRKTALQVENAFPVTAYGEPVGSADVPHPTAGLAGSGAGSYPQTPADTDGVPGGNPDAGRPPSEKATPQ